MKKHIILSMLAISAMGMSAAVTGTGVYPGYAFKGISPDGKYVTSYTDGTTIICNLETGQEYFYLEGYGPSPTLPYWSADGRMVGYNSEQEIAVYWYEGNWHEIESAANRGMSYAWGISPDGTRICGLVAKDRNSSLLDDLGLLPYYVDLQANGNYGEVNVLPHPNVDWSGRPPLYVMANIISDNGKIIAGQVVDAFSNMQPIVYTQDDNGDWSYKMLLTDLFAPEGVGDIPEFPGENRSPESFMSAQERAEYEAAVTFWEENYPNDYSKYPDVLTYLTDEEYQEYMQYTAEWQPKWNAWEAAYNRLRRVVPALGLNDIWMNADGSTIYCQHLSTFFDTDESDYVTETRIYAIDTQSGEYTTTTIRDLTPEISCVLADGTILAHQDDAYDVTQAYILPAGESEFMLLQDYFKTANPLVYDWMTAHMYNNVETYTVDPVTGEEVDHANYYYTTGIPFANPDGSMYVFTMPALWASVSTYQTVGYIIYTDTAGVESITTESNVDVKALPGGELQFTGDVKTVNVYNLSGSEVLRAENPGNTLSTGLVKGIYVVKVVSGDNNVTVKKLHL